MTDKNVDRSCREFAEVLASRIPVPGGGGASAYVGALGASLCTMVARYSADNPRFCSSEKELHAMIVSAEAIASDLVALVDDDARAYGLVSKAYAIPRDDPKRPQAIQNALREAALPPYRIMLACSQALVLLEDLADKASRLLLSDVACGAVFCRAALQGASLTLFANTTSMKDRARAKELEDECDALLETWLPRADALAQRATESARNRK